MIMKVKEMISLLEMNGWFLYSHKASSHRQYKHLLRKVK